MVKGLPNDVPIPTFKLKSPKDSNYGGNRGRMSDSDDSNDEEALGLGIALLTEDEAKL